MRPEQKQPSAAEFDQNVANMEAARQYMADNSGKLCATTALIGLASITTFVMGVLALSGVFATAQIPSSVVLGACGVIVLGVVAGSFLGVESQQTGEEAKSMGKKILIGIAIAVAVICAAIYLPGVFNLYSPSVLGWIVIGPGVAAAGITVLALCCAGCVGGISSLASSSNT